MVFSSPPLSVGDRAPDFTLPTPEGELTLSKLCSRESVVLYFYPMDETPGCSMEACAFRDSYDAFREQGAEIVGISSDSLEEHRHFAERFHLPFRLVSDADHLARNLYGVPATMGLVPGRVTYVVDTNQTIRYVYSSQFMILSHVDHAFEVCQQLQQERAAELAQA